MLTEDLYQQLKQKNPVLRQRAISNVLAIATNETIPNLIQILSQEDPLYRKGASEALTVIGLDAIPALAQKLNTSQQDYVRASCVQTLSAIARFFSRDYPGVSFPQVAVDALGKTLKDTNSGIKVSATGTLGVIGKPALNILLEAIKTDDISLKLSVIQAIVSLNVLKGDEQDPKTFEDYQTISDLLSKIAVDESEDSYVREVARTAFTRMEASKVKMRH